VNTQTWSKKLVFAILVVACATLLAYGGRLPIADWLSLVKTIGVTYILAQGGIDLFRGKEKPDGVQPG